MDKRFGLIFGAISAFVMLFYASFSIIKGGTLDLAKAVVLIMPFVFIIFINLRKSWHVLIPLFLTMNDLSVPIYGLKKLTPILVLLFMATGILILERAVKHSRHVLDLSWADRYVAIVAIIFTIRFAYDRPGFVALGMAQGGFFRALTITSAAWLYFTVKILVSQAVFTRKQLVRVLSAVAVICAITVYNGSKTGVFIGRFFGGTQFWMLCALMLSLLATATSVQKRQLLFYMTSFGFLLMGAFSQFRSRVFFFAAQIFSVAFFTKRLRKTILIIGLGGIVGLVGMIALTGKVPGSMARFASLFMQVEQVTITSEGGSGAYGWEDSGRGELYAAAWRKIKQAPFVGSGFELNVSEAIGILSVGNRVGIEMLILSDSYHNSIVLVAAKCGLPAAILVSISFIIVIIRFVKWLCFVQNLEVKSWGMMIAAFWFANTFMMLMNGGPNEFFAELILSGFMMGMMNNSSISEEKGRAESPGTDAGAPRSRRLR